MVSAPHASESRSAELKAYTSAAGRQRFLAGAAALFGLAAAAVAALRLSGAAGAMADAVASAWALASAGLTAAALLGRARSLELKADTLQHAAPAGVEPAVATESRCRLLRQRARRLGTWVPVAAAAALSLAAAVAAGVGWTRGTPWQLTDATAGLGAACCLAGAFAVLVMERSVAVQSTAAFPEAPRLADLLRVPIAVLLICAVGCLLLYREIALGAVAGRIADGLCLLVAVEMLARAAATLFAPYPPLIQAKLVPFSALAGALHLQRPQRIGAAMTEWLGIDLSRSWALAYIRAAFVPVLVTLLLFAWGLSGVEALRVDQRAIYERLGRPVAVVGPGLHLHLPWPLGRLRLIDLGVMHDVPITFDAAASGGAAGVRTGAEAYPPPSADRLWDQPHPGENAYLVASLARGQQSFESVDIDLRVVYRIGLSDAAAMRAAYSVSDPQRVVQAEASRLLARYFASHTLDDVLGGNRASMSHDLTADLQARLDLDASGLEVMAVVVEAIHPPLEAADAYHAVQATEVRALTAVAEEQGEAAQIHGDALAGAIGQGDASEAGAREMLAEAQTRTILFDADRTADAHDPTAFRMERRFDTLAAGLAHRRIAIIDHRLQASPVIDLRPGGTAAADIPATTTP